MTKPRNILMPAGSMGTFHVVSRCVRREFLLERDGRRERLAQGLARWLPHVGLDLHAYAIMSNHVHLVLRLRPDRVAGWDAARKQRDTHPPPNRLRPLAPFSDALSFTHTPTSENKGENKGTHTHLPTAYDR